MIIPFYKFPSTPYLVEPHGGISRSDKIMRKDEKDSFLSQEIIVEEKIDGTNLGISFNHNGVMILQHRGSYVQAPYIGQWKALPQWLDYKRDLLFDVLLDRYILFGEWCYLKHSVFYDSLPDWFLAFDIYDKENEFFLSVKKRNKLLSETDVKTVPFITQGVFTLSVLDSLIGKSNCGNSLMEGLYLRKDGHAKLIQRAKYVRSSFSQLIEKHWTSQRPKKNQLYSNRY